MYQILDHYFAIKARDFHLFWRTYERLVALIQFFSPHTGYKAAITHQHLMFLHWYHSRHINSLWSFFNRNFRHFNEEKGENLLSFFSAFVLKNTSRNPLEDLQAQFKLVPPMRHMTKRWLQDLNIRETSRLSNVDMTLSDTSKKTLWRSYKAQFGLLKERKLLVLHDQS